MRSAVVIAVMMGEEEREFEEWRVGAVGDVFWGNLREGEDDGEVQCAVMCVIRGLLRGLCVRLVVRATTSGRNRTPGNTDSSELL